MIEYLKLLAIALALTIAVEIVVAWIFRLRSKTELSTITLINVMTNPLLNYLILIIGYFQLFSSNLAPIVLLETSVVLIEWRLLLWVLRQKARKLLVLSVLMNVFSYLAGLIIIPLLRI